MIKRFYILLLAIVASVGMSWATTTDLASITDNYTAQDGEILTGTLGVNVKISIADGATVTLLNANINGDKAWTTGDYAGLTCLGDATITIVGTNSVSGFSTENGYPGIYVPSGKTLIINGTGSLTAQSSTQEAAGIGAGRTTHCGNIEIQSGKITAIAGGEEGAGIGGGFNADCGNITISGGIVTAVGGDYSAGIGGGRRSGGTTDAGHCGNILISGGVVSATSGKQAAAIGGGRGNNNAYKSNCGTITITNTALKVYAEQGGEKGSTNTIGAAKYGNCGAVTIGGNTGVINDDPYTYRTKEDGEIVVVYINAIGTVVYTQECKDKIDIARELYDALEDSQKGLVTNYQTLLDAEAAYAALIPAEPANSCGDGLTWELNDGVLTISYDGEGTGEMTDFDYEYDESPVNVAPWKENKSDIATVVIGDGVKSIGNYAFNDLGENFTAVTIANSVERIGLSAFMNAKWVTEITLPSSLKTIDRECFAANFGFTSITIPSGVTSIGYHAFGYCTALTSLTCEATTPPTLASGVFYKITSKTSDMSNIPLYVPSESVAAYQDANQWNAFNVQAIPGGGSTPANPCGDGVTWELKDGAMTISYTGTGTGAMENYSYYTKTPWYDSRKSITSIIIEDGVTTVGNYSFMDLENLQSVVIGNDVVTIGSHAFEQCGSSFTSLTLGNSIVEIGEQAFINNSRITSINLPNTLQTIGEDAFYGCTKISSLTIPSSVTSIGDYAFGGCSLIAYIIAEPTTPPSTEENTFISIVTPSYIPLYVPNGSVADYTAAERWNTFNIQGYDPSTGPTIEPVPATPNQLSGAFTINGDGDQINFSKGNLQYVGDAWQFAENQWNIIGNDQADNNRDLFGWGTGDAPNKVSTTLADYAVYHEWGTNMGDGWYTLSRDEWTYLFQSRTNAANLYAPARVNGVSGFVILPDEFTLPSGLSFTAGVTNYGTNFYANAAWRAMENAGAVFLPVDGYRYDGNKIKWVGQDGFYWSSTVASEGASAWSWLISASNGARRDYYNLHYGMSVRLVKAVVLTPDDVMALINAIGEVEYTAESKAKIDAARKAYDGLSEADKALVTNYSTLQQAEAAYQAFIQAEADKVIAKIAALPNPVTAETAKLSVYNKVVDARTAYDALKAEEKALVTNLAILEAAEAFFDALPGGIPEGALKGAFTINAGGDRILFSKGNLQYVGSWQFAAHQWDIIGAGQADDNRDLFGWGTGDAPNKVSETSADYTTYTEWGTQMGAGWYTLDYDEWKYIFKTRANAANLYAPANVNGVNGIVLLPDEWKQPDGTTFTSGVQNFSTNVYADEAWTAMENAGAVFLPVAGYRYKGNINWVGQSGFYWTSTVASAGSLSWSWLISANSARRDYYNLYYGMSVRLVNAAGAGPIDAAQAAVDLINAIPNPVTLDEACVKAIKDAREAVTALGANASLIDETDMAKLTKAEADYTNLIKAEADKVVAKINEIPSPMTTENTKLSVYQKVQDARAGYDALTAEQKALVEAATLKRLTDAEAAFAPYVGGMPAEALSGKFTINAGGDQIAFSQGNLQATTADLGANWTWSFAANQWDFIGNAVANTAISDIKSVSTNGTVDLFGWSTAATYYGISNNPGGAYYTGDFIDWGTNAISNGGNTANAWHTLAHDEWDYLFNTRTTTSGIRYAKATVNGIPGIILLPDDWSATYYALSNTNDYEVDFNSNVITTSDWTNSLEANGVVFLPAAGERLGADVNEVGSKGHYWSSTFKTDYNAYCLSFNSYNLDASDYINRREGYSVRLVVAAPVNYIAEAQAAVDLINAIPTPAEMTPECLNAVKAAREAVDALGEAASLIDASDLQKLTDAEAIFVDVLNVWISGDCRVILWKDSTMNVQKLPGDGNGAMADYSYMSRAPWYSAHWYDPQPNDIVIKSVTIEEGVTYFGDYAFAWMDGLKTVTIPASVTSIHQDAFYWSKAIDDIYLTADTANLTWGAKGDSSFKPEKATRCHVPADLLTAYQEKFGTINMTFVGDLDPITPLTPEQQQALDAVKGLINAIPSPVVYTTACKDAIDAARAAYDALTPDMLKQLVSNYAVLTAAEATYESLKDVVVVEAKINELPNPVQESDLKLSVYNKVTGAREAYDALTADQKALVGNYSILTAAEAAFAPYVGGGTGVEGLLTTITVSNSVVNHSVENIVDINQDAAVLGENGWTSGKVVVSAKPGFTITKVESFQNDGWIGAVDEDTSSPFEVSITNGMTLTKLNVYGYEALSPIAQAQAALALINAIPDPVTLDEACVKAIKDAREAVTALGENASLIDETDMDKLTKAEADYTNLIKAGADAVTAKINNIPQPVTLKLATRDSINNARAAYDALTADQKLLVTNYDVLTAAEATMATLNPGGGMPAGALSGKFTINNAGDQVAFSKGNLQATTEDLGEHWTWGFAANQWEVIGDAAANNAVNGNRTVSANGTVDLFGWSTPTTYYGIHNSTNSDYYSGDFREWGENITGATWKTLSPSDWIYIISNRADAAQKQGQATVNGVNGYIFLPDEWELPTGLSFTAKPNNWTANVYEGDDWTAMENAGAVFLPKSSWRSGNTVSPLSYGYYWSSDYNNYSNAMAYYFKEDLTITGTGIPRYAGIYVRLVTADLGSPSPLDSAQAVKDLIEAIPSPVTLDSKDAIDAAREAYDALSEAGKGALDAADVKKLTDAEAALTALNQAEADKVIAKINNIPLPVELKLATRDSIQNARAAYDALNAAQQALVTNYQTLLDAEDALADLVPTPTPVPVTPTVRDMNELKVGDIIYEGDQLTIMSSPRYINNEVIRDNNCPYTLMKSAGETSYVLKDKDGSYLFTDGSLAITPASVGLLVTNADHGDINVVVYSLANVLDSAQAVKDLIDAIPTPVEYPTSGPAIAAALVAYNQLSDAAKGALDDADVQKMTDAAIQYAALDAIAAIEAIPAEIVYDPAVKAAIETARGKYDALIDASKALVDAEVVAKLTNAEQAWADLVALIEHTVTYIGKDGELKNEKVALLHIPNPAPDFNGYEFVRWDVKAGDFLEEGLRIKAVYTPIITTNPVAYDTLVYNGTAQELVAAGVASDGHIEYRLNEGDWSAELPKADMAAEYVVDYKLVREGHEDYMAGSVNAVIAKAPVTYVAPQAYDTLAYNYNAQVLVTAGQTNDGTIEYSLNPNMLDSWSADLPQAMNAGTYAVYFRVQGDLNHFDSIAPAPVAVTIAKRDIEVTAPVAYDTLVYNSLTQALAAAGSADFSTMEYTLTPDNGEGWSADMPQAVDAGTYAVYYRVQGDNNHNDYPAHSIAATIAQASLTITAENKEVIYGDAAPEFTATYSGWMGQDDATVISNLQITSTYAAGSSVGTYAIVPSGATALNYTMSYVNGKLTVNKAVVKVEKAEAQIAKFADGHTPAVVLNQGKLDGVKLNDPLTHVTTAAFSSAEVSEHLTITLFYELTGDAALLANYDLQPTSEVFTTEGVIIEPFLPNNDDDPEDKESKVQEGIEVYAYGYCEGDSVGLKYHLNSGNPNQYMIEYADSLLFKNVGWTDLEITGPEGVIYIDVPVNTPTGDYKMTVYFRDSSFVWLPSQPLNVTFHVNLPETYVKPLFNNTIILVDTCNCFTDIQWYHRADASEQWQPISGANGHYLHVEGKLTGEYFVKAKMNGVDTYTCGQEDMETLYGADNNKRQAIVRAYPNPVVNTTTVAIENSDSYEHNLRIVNLMGIEVMNTTFEGDHTVVEMSGYSQGNYMISVDGIMVKVLKQ